VPENTGGSEKVFRDVHSPVDSFIDAFGGDRMAIIRLNHTIHHPPPPTRGDTMKFTRRHDLDPQTRIEIVKDVWLHQGIYGKMTQIAQAYHISRTFLYQLSWLPDITWKTS